MDLTDEVIKSQIEKSIDTFVSQYKILWQVTAALMIGEITITGIAFENTSASLLLLGVLFPIASAFVFVIAIRMMIPVCFVAISLENKVDEKIDWLIGTYIRYFWDTKYTDGFSKAIKANSIDDRFKELNKMKSLWFRSFSTWLYIGIFILLALGHLIVAFLLQRYFNWDFF